MGVCSARSNQDQRGTGEKAGMMKARWFSPVDQIGRYMGMERAADVFRTSAPRERDGCPRRSGTSLLWLE